MKRKHFLLFAGTFFHLCNLQAQTANATYTAGTTIFNKNSIGQKVVILPRQNLNNPTDDYIIFTSNDQDIATQNYTGVEIVSTTSNGTYINSKVIQMPLDHHHITKTRDGGILFAGYASSSNGYLYVIKFNENLVPLWQRKIPIIPKTILGPNENVDIEPIFNQASQIEYFYISFSEGNTIMGQENFPAQGVVKINQNGTLQWHKFYAGPNFQNEAHALTSFTPPGSDQTLISLASTGRPITNLSPVTYSFPRICFMTIDQSGGIVTQLKGWWPLSDNERQPDIVWDETKNEFIVVFTSNTTSLTHPVYSSLGIVKLDATYDNAGSGGLYFWLSNNSMWGEENHGVSITKNTLNKYIISGWVKVEEGIPYQPPYLDFMEAPFVFAIDKNDLLTTDISPVHTYRRPTDATVTGHVVKYDNQFHVTDALNFTVLAPTKFMTASGYHFPRLIRTDNTFFNCYDYQVKLVRRQPQWLHQIYIHGDIPYNQNASESNLAIDPSSFTTTFCNSNPSYRLAADDDGGEPSVIRVYPNIVTDFDKEISCEINDLSLTGELLDITITNTLGQRVYKSDFQYNASTIKKITCDRLSPGFNVINIFNKGKSVYTGKIVKM